MLRKRSLPPNPPEKSPDDKSESDREDELIVTAKLKSGRFEASIAVPLFASSVRKQAFIESWLMLIEQGIKVGRSNTEREYLKDEPSGRKTDYEPYS